MVSPLALLLASEGKASDIAGSSRAAHEQRGACVAYSTASCNRLLKELRRLIEIGATVEAKDLARRFVEQFPSSDVHDDDDHGAWIKTELSKLTAREQAPAPSPAPPPPKKKKAPPPRQKKARPTKKSAVDSRVAPVAPAAPAAPTAPAPSPPRKTTPPKTPPRHLPKSASEKRAAEPFDAPNASGKSDAPAAHTVLKKAKTSATGNQLATWPRGPRRPFSPSLQNIWDRSFPTGISLAATYCAVPAPFTIPVFVGAAASTLICEPFFKCGLLSGLPGPPGEPPSPTASVTDD